MIQTEYGNWIPQGLMCMLYGTTAILAVITIICISFGVPPIISIIISILFILSLGMTIYMQIVRNTFDFEKGNLMGTIHEYVTEHLDWDGNGKLIDIGCGSGAMTIRLAKKHTSGTFVGIDFFGTQWDYNKKLCDNNATAEKVNERCSFEQGDAAQLKYADNTFDAAVSNFVFHEVNTQKDKTVLIKEALRVVKKGGAFAFHDLFEQKSLYGNIQDIIEELKAEGVNEIHYIANTQNAINIPSYIKAPWLLSNLGLLYGKK